MKQTIKLVSIILVVAMILSLLPANVFAAPSKIALENSNKKANNGKTTLASTANSTVILACSDVQEPTNSYLFSNGDYTKQTQILTNIVSQVKTVYPTIDGFFCGGDYNFDVTREDRLYTENGVEKTYTSSIAQTRTQQNTVILSNAVKDLTGITDDEIVLVQGNHDTFCDALTATGGYDKGTYSVYVINEQSFPSGGTATQNLCQQTADGLRFWLSELKQANANKPVFILSHVPLHYSTRVISDGDAVYAQLLYDAIEAYGNDLNIIFLYGHDHAHGDDDYLGGAAQFLTRGDKITVAQSGNRNSTLEKTLNFTYMNYGFVGYFWDTWGQQSGTINRNTDYTLTMTTFEIYGGDVTIRRWDENGQHILKAAGAGTQGDRGFSDPLPANTDTYASPQIVRSPKSSSSGEAKSFTDSDTSVTVKTSSGSGITVTRRTDIAAKTGVTDFLAYDITVEGFTDGTTAVVTMPSRPGFNKVWWYNNGVWEEVEDYVFSGNTVTFTTNHFSTYIDGVEVPLDDGAWYLVKTPASELETGDTVMVLNGTEDNILYSAVDTSYGATPDTAWADPYGIESLYSEEGYGTITPVQYDGKTYYSYNAGMQQILTDYPAYLVTVSDGKGLMNGNGKYLNLSFNPFNWVDFEAYKTTAAGTINADGTISAVIGGITYYLTYNEAAGDDWYGFVPRTAQDSSYTAQSAQFVFYRLEQFTAPSPIDPTDPDDDDYTIVDGNADLVELTDFVYRTVEADGNACLYHTNTMVTPQTPFANGNNDKIEFYNAFVVDGHTYNVCIKVKFINPPAGTQLYWGTKTYSADGGFLSIGQFRNTSNYVSWWTEADMFEPDTDIEWELWLEDANGTHITDEMLAEQTGYHLSGGSVYVAPNEYVSVYSRDNTLYTNIPDGIEYIGDPVNRWHTIDNNDGESTYNLSENYIGGIARTDGVIKGSYRKDYTDAGCELALGTYRAEPAAPEEGNDLVFTKTATQTQPAAENENYFDIELNVKAPASEVDPAVVILLDVSSSMKDQCAICGLSHDAHEIGMDVTHWDGNSDSMTKTHDGIANHQWTERMPIAKASAVSFAEQLHNSTAFDHCYVKLITFGGSIGLNEEWIDIKDNTSYNALVNKINGLEKVSGTNIANALKTSYEAFTDGFPTQCDPSKSYLVVMSDGASNRTANSGISPTGDNDEALNEDYMESWYSKWSEYPHFEDSVVNEEENAPVYMGPVWYADRIHSLGTEIYSVILGNSLDYGDKTGVENWRYIIGIGLDNDNYMDSFSDVCSHANTEEELTSFYTNVAMNINYVKDITVTDPMAENIEFICFVDANGNEIGVSNGVSFDDTTKTLTWDLPNDVADNKLYYRIRVQNENFTATAETQDIPTNGTTRAEYTLVVNGVSSRKYQDAEIPEVETYEGTLEFDKVDKFGNALEGVEFTLTLDDDCCDYDEDYNGAGTDNHAWSATAESDEDGHVVFTHVPSGHTFTLTETDNRYLDTLPAIDCGATVAYGVTAKTGSDWTSGKIINEVSDSIYCVPDVVVIDYGLYVDINVLANDFFGDNGTLVGVGEEQPEGDYTATLDADFGSTLTTDHGTAEVRDGKVRYTPKDMQMDEADVFSYAVRYQSRLGDIFYFYSTVTVVPAANMYFEQDFVTFNGAGWTDVGTADTVGQAEDRPGEFFLKAYDANNVYGFDSAYLNCTTYSYGAAKKVSVSQDYYDTNESWPNATFTFTGSRFDLISLTSKETGFIRVAVYEGTDTTADPVQRWAVNTYFGYEAATDSENPWVKVTYTYNAAKDKWSAGNKFVAEVGDDVSTEVPDNPADGDTFVTYHPNYIWTSASSNNALYEIPVIRSTELGYGTYTVVVTPCYSPFFDQTKTGSYDFYLDSVRIYGPAQGVDDYYVQDNEAWPQYIHIRKNLLDQNAFAANASGADGAVFIDGFATDGDIDEYHSFGPNNEVYLRQNQAIAFTLKTDNAANVASVQLGVKSLNGAATNFDIIGLNGSSTLQRTCNLASATEMFGVITGTVVWDTETNTSNIIIIRNNSDSILSLTNIKVTYKSDPNGAVRIRMSLADAKAAAEYVKAAAFSGQTPVDENFEQHASDAAEPAIRSAYLKLDNNINVVYAADLPADYENPYMVFTMNGAEFTVTEYTVNEQGQCCFEFTNITPQYMGDNITAVLYAECGNETCTDNVDSYSIRQYCLNQMERYSDDTRFVALLSDLLVYGAAAQLYTGYKTDCLVTDCTPSNDGISCSNKLSFTGTRDASADWTSASLVLKNTIAIRYTFYAEDISGLTVQAAVNGRTRTFGEKEFSPVTGQENLWYIDFSGICATEFDDAVTASFYRSGMQIGRTISYSVNTYIVALQSNISAPYLSELLQALYHYGWSASHYTYGLSD